MSPERAFNTVLDAAVLQWAANANQTELREALDTVLEQLGDNTLRRALALRWSKTDHRGRALITGWMQLDDGARQWQLSSWPARSAYGSAQSAVPSP